MTGKQRKTSQKKEKPKVHKKLEGFEIAIDQFGEIKSNLNIEKINEFLDENVDDKKLTDREDFSDIKKESKKKQ